VRYAETSERWTPELKTLLSGRHALFVKASRAMKFETVVGAL
jgi:hypothetical protein